MGVGSLWCISFLRSVWIFIGIYKCGIGYKERTYSNSERIFAICNEASCYLFPIHIAMMTYCAIAELIQRTNVLSVLECRLTQGMLIQSWIPIRNIYFSLNGVSWYLSSLLFAYFCFPYVWAMMSRWRTKRTCIAAIVAVAGVEIMTCCMLYFISASDDIVYYITYIFPMYRIFDFILGCCIGWLFNNRQIKSGHFWTDTVCEIIGLILLILVEFIFMSEIVPYAFRYQLLFLPVSIFVIWVYARSTGWISRVVARSRGVTVIAAMSGPSFLIHHKLIGTLKIVSNYFEPLNHNVVIAVISFEICYIFSVIYARLYKLRKVA